MGGQTVSAADSGPAKESSDPSTMPTTERRDATGADATIDFRRDETGPDPTVQARPVGPPAEYAFLDPRRDGDELGWLAHYRVRRAIGAGGMGLVFHAEDTHLNRPVALKVIRPELAASPEAAARFAREARSAAAIKHDNVVTIYQVGEARGVAFLAMEYLQGISLQQLARSGPQALDRPHPAHRQGGCFRTLVRPPVGTRPPRHQAREHLARGAQRPGQDSRFRSGQGRTRGCPDHPVRGDHGHSGIHVAGAGGGRPGHILVRPLQPRMRAVPALLRSTSVPGQEHPFRTQCAGNLHAHSASRDEAGYPRGTQLPGDAAAGEIAGPATRIRTGRGRHDPRRRAPARCAGDRRPTWRCAALCMRSTPRPSEGIPSR